jgi:hypothetical protein
MLASMAKRRPRHAEALKLPYEVYVAINGGVETCGICGRPGKTRRLHRDHDHRTGMPRGLLCFRCNRILAYFIDIPWLEAAIIYLHNALTHGPSARDKYEAEGIDAFEPVD